MSRAVLSLGSNLGDRAAHLRQAITYLAPWTLARSGMYETAPWGPVRQGDFLNAVVVVHDENADARRWLERAQRCEQAADRVHDVRYGPRTLDVDIVTVDDVICDDPQLLLPHPRAAERAFVLVPWAAIEPGGLLPGVGTVQDLLGRVSADELAGVRARPDLSWAG